MQSLNDKHQIEMTGTMDAYSHVSGNGSWFWSQIISDPTTTDKPLPPLPTLEVGFFETDTISVKDWLNQTQYQEIQKAILAGSTSLFLTFLDLPQGYGPAAVVMFGQIYSNGETDVKFRLYTFEIGWIPTITRYGGGPDVVFGQLRTISSRRLSAVSNLGLHKATANKEWLNTINPVIPGLNVTLLNYMMSQGQNLTWDVTNIPSVLSLMLTTALANMSPLPNAPCGFQFDGSASLAATTEPCSNGFEQDAIRYPITLFAEGYGYGPDVLAIRISLAILLLYCILVIAHIVYSLWTGLSSSAWDSVSELGALLLNSRQAQELDNTCAGIQTTDVFKHPVRIAASATEESFEHLELLFASADDKHTFSVKANQEYT